MNTLNKLIYPFVIPPKEFRIFSMSRSGHTAIQNWIAFNMDLTGNEWEHYDFGKNFSSGMFKLRKRSKKLNILSFEDCIFIRDRRYISYSTRMSWDPKFIDDFTQYDNSSIVKYCIIIRDPYNWLSSKKKFKNKEILAGNLDQWCIDFYKILLKECLRYTNYLPDLVDINYNKWFSSKKYRKNLAKRLDIPFTDKGINKVPHAGGGSSFDGIKLKGQDMNVLNRYKEYKDDKKFKGLFDEELIELTEKYFNVSYPF